MSYTKKDKERTIRYVREKLHRMEVRYQNKEYKKRIEPAIRRSGLPAATFIKTAIDEKIDRDRLGEEKEK